MKKISLRFFKIVFHIFLGVVLGCSVTVFYVSKNESFYAFLQKKIEEQISEQYDCEVTCCLQDIDWLSLQLNVSDIFICTKNPAQQWSIYADKLIISASWISLLTQLKLETSAL